MVGLVLHICPLEIPMEYKIFSCVKIEVMYPSRKSLGSAHLGSSCKLFYDPLRWLNSLAKGYWCSWNQQRVTGIHGGHNLQRHFSRTWRGWGNDYTLFYIFHNWLLRALGFCLLPTRRAQPPPTATVCFLWAQFI